MLMFVICFLFPLTSYAGGHINIPVKMNISQTGEQDLPGEWEFLFKLREEDGSAILEESSKNLLTIDNIIWNISQGNEINKLLIMEINNHRGWLETIPGVQYKKTYSISIFNKDPENPMANYDISGWEYDDSKYFIDIVYTPPGTCTFEIRDKNGVVVPEMVFNNKYNQSKTYTSEFSAKLEVKQSGTETPPPQEFQFKFDNVDLPDQPDFNDLEIVDSIATNGVGSFEKNIKVKINVDDIKAVDSKWRNSTSLPELYTAVFKLNLKNDAVPYWEYDNSYRYILFFYNDKYRTLGSSILSELNNDVTMSFATFTNNYTKMASSGGGYTPTDSTPVDSTPTDSKPTDSKPTDSTPTPPEFTKIHLAYITGYPDGSMQPIGNITRAETATMIYRLLTEARRSEIKVNSNIFSDVKGSSWYNESVSSMANGKYVFGYPDGTFRGNKSITRAEFVAMLVRFIEPAKGKKVFSDVGENHWAYNHIAAASAAGWISGYEGGKFEPDKSITRAEAVSILNRLLNRGVNEKSTLLNFKNWQDNPVDSWYYYEIIEAGNSHEHMGTRPSENWTKLLD